MSGQPIPINMDSFLAGVERRAYRIAMLATRQHSDALDIVQESMLKMVQYYQNHPKNEWPPLFHTILQRSIMQWHRQQKRQRRWFWQNEAEESQDNISNAAAPEHEIPANVLERTDQVEAVIQAVQQLPIRQQQAFLLRKWEGFDVATSAKIMECSEGSVKTHLSRALKQLRGQLEENP